MGRFSASPLFTFPACFDVSSLTKKWMKPFSSYCQWLKCNSLKLRTVFENWVMLYCIYDTWGDFIIFLFYFVPYHWIIISPNNMQEKKTEKIIHSTPDILNPYNNVLWDIVSKGYSPYVSYKSVQAGIWSSCYFIWMFVPMNWIDVYPSRVLFIQNLWA